MVGRKWWLGLILGLVTSLNVSFGLFGAEESKGTELDEAALVATELLGDARQAAAGRSDDLDEPSSKLLVEVKLSDGVVSMPASVRDSFNFLKALQVGSGKYFNTKTSIESGFWLKKENLDLLVALMTGAAGAASYDFKTLVGLICLADYLLINDWELLRPVLTRIKELATPALVAQMAAELPEIRVPLGIDVIVHVTKFAHVVNSMEWRPDGQGYGVLFGSPPWQRYGVNLWDDRWQQYDMAGVAQGPAVYNVDNLEWQPDGQGYGVLFRGGRWQRYNMAGVAKGRTLVGVSRVEWQPDGQGYGVLFRGGRWQRYNMAGVAQGLALVGVSRVEWQPDGQGYGVLFRDGRWQRYNLAREPQGTELVGVSYVRWQPDGHDYWVRFRDGRWQRYNMAGIEQGQPLINVKYVSWQPDGQGYGVRFRGRRWQRYDLAGVAQWPVLEGVDWVKWQPDGQGYCVKFRDGRRRRYNLAGVAQGPVLSNVFEIQWQPDGQGYAVIFDDGRWQRYDMDGVAQGPVLEGVHWVKWQPDGQGYAVRFRNYKLAVYQSLPQVEQETFGAQLAVQAVLNEYSITKTPVELSLTLERLLGAELSSMLQKYGYVKLKPSYFRALGIDIAAMLLPAKQGGAGAGAGAGAGSAN